MRTKWAGLLALVLLAGCGGTDKKPADGGGESVGVREAHEGTAPAAEGKKYTIAVIPKGLGHQFWNTVHAGAEAAAKEIGGEIIWNGPAKETEIAKQINIVTDMVNRKVDAIVLAACDENALVDTVQMAMDRGIPVITIDSGVQSDRPVSFVATDNVEGAKQAARTLAGLVGEAGICGVIPFVPGAGTSEMRETGFAEGLKEFPNMSLGPKTYCFSDVAKAMGATQDMLRAEPNLKGIFAANEPGCLGAMRAIEAAGKTGEVKLVAFDASPDQIEGLRAGTVQALIVQNPFRMGYEGVMRVIDHIEGREVAKRIDTGVYVVTKENLETEEIRKLLNPE